uniref:Elongator complex protein 2 n=2 Tax=Arion vulgaris TaxID=1028688 RepID=A0A0B7ACE9_9EUPU
MAFVNTCYTAAGCNRCPYCADWGRNGFICYGYSKAVAVYQPEGSNVTGGIQETFIGHKGNVNCVTWVHNGHQDETEFVSGSVDSTAILWKFDKNKKCNQPVCTLNGHEGSVICVSACNIPRNDNSINETTETLIVTASADSTVRIWSRLDNEVKEQQVLSFGSGFALTVATFIIPGTNVPILACGCDDHKVHLYVPGENGKFFRILVLPGHEDWVRSLHFTTDDCGDIFLATCSQDHLIRVWRLAQRSDSAQSAQQFQPVSDLQIDEDITAKETVISVKANDKEINFAVRLESVLCGHENWVYSVRWQPCTVNDNGLPRQSMKLLSASMDKTMIIWSPDLDTGIWIEEVRVGDVGGNTLGFFGGLFSPCGQSILGHGYQGAFNQWTYNKVSSVWEPQVTGGGHFSSVVDLSWSGDGGHYILSASTDQTTRLHAPWIREHKQPTWYEIARPQVHGYDLQCLAVLGKYSFASGADEKLVRVFKAPRNFISNFCQICGHSLTKELEHKECLSLPEGANVPALGLSNKAVYSGGGDADRNDKKLEVTKTGQYPENYFTSINLKAPPSEDQLLQNTLWPEEAKLYGHGYEIFSLAANPEGTLLASACKAAKTETANILLWDTNTKKTVASLSSCTLTVTQMAFNHEGNRLLAVSRDRTWALFKKSDTGQFVLEASVDKKTSHSRIIWSCAWSHDDKSFFTASRDKKVLVWSTDSVTKATSKSPPVPVGSLVLPDSVTAVSLAPMFVQSNRYFVSLGLDDGQIFLYTWSQSNSSNTDNEWKLAVSLNHSEAHHLTVTRLAFRPQTGRLGHSVDSSRWLQLASCGADHAVRVYDIDLMNL